MTGATEEAGAGAASIEDAAAELYGLPIGEFVAARDDLARRTRAGGDRELADAVKALRKPTVVADALNRAVRADPAAIDALLDAADRLRLTQEALLAGEEAPAGADFAADQAAYRAAVEAVAAGAPSHEVEVRAAVEAAATGGLGPQLRAACFAAAPGPTGGLGPFVPGAGGLASGSSASRPGRRPAGSSRSRPAGRSATPGAGAGAGGDADETGSGPAEPSPAERRLAERARRAAERAVGEAESGERAAGEVAAAAGQVVAGLDGEVAELVERLDGLRTRRDEAVVARAEADAALAAAAERLAKARAVLDELSD